MKSWIMWMEMYRLIAALFMLISLAAAVTAVILLFREGLVEKLIGTCRSGYGIRLGIAAAAAFVWILVIGKSALAMEGNQGAGIPARSEAAGTAEAAEREENAGPGEPGAEESRENAGSGETETADPSKSGPADSAKSGAEDTPDPGTGDSSDPGTEDSSESGPEDSSDTGTTDDPTTPGTEDPSDPGTEEPQEPEIPDTSAPSIQIRMEENVNRDAEGTPHCRSDNAGIAVVMEDVQEGDRGIGTYRVTVTDSKGNTKERNWVKGEKEEAPPHTELRLDAGEVAELADGMITVKVRAEDLAGNCQENRLCLILDTHGPVLKEIRTVSGGAPDSPSAEAGSGETGGESSGAPISGAAAEGNLYDDGDRYYNDIELTTIFKMEDENEVFWEISYLVLPGIGSGSGENSAERRRSGSGKLGSVTISEEGIYGGFRICGKDLAGNPLTAGSDCRCSRDAEGFYEEDGEICLPGRKIIDRTPPEAEIRYSSAADGYLYWEKGQETVYYAADVLAAPKITDRCGDKEMPVDTEAYGLVRWGGPAGSEEAVTSALTEACAVMRDGRVQFGAFGRDRAGNALTVREVFADGVLEEGLYRDGSGERTVPYLPQTVRSGQADEESCAPGAVIVRDTVNPVATVSVSEPVGNPAGIDRTSGLLYFGNEDSLYEGGVKAVRVRFEVEDENADGDRIGIRKAYEGVPAGKNCEEISPGFGSAAADRPSVTQEGTRLLFAITHRPGGSDMPDGVYQFGIAGTDKAGNPLVRSKTKGHWDEDFRMSDEGGSGNGVLVTCRMVVDTEAPSGEICVRNQSGEEYCVMEAHERAWVTRREGFMPFRREREAEITFRAADTSPAAVSFRLLSTSGARNAAPPDGTVYKACAEGKVAVLGGQIFRLERAFIRDRAGNCSAVLAGTVNFYLDTRLPDADLRVPTASVRAVSAITARDPRGQALYGGSVSLEITAQDPDEAGGGSGLREVFYDLYIDGRAVRTGEVLFRDGFAETIQSGAEPAESVQSGATPEEASRNGPASAGASQGRSDEKPVYSYKGSLEIPSGGIYESNDIEIVVHAQDNAGNLSNSRDGGNFRFGIDTKRPRILISYDNNEVINGRYLTAPRTAMITVRERNFDASGIRVSAPGAGAGEWKFLRKGPGGDADEWGMELKFEADGAYTVEISGADALGNPAYVEYKGLAPRSFIVDRTPPLIEVIWDNHDVRNGKYYNRARRAVIRITDLSFDPRGVKILPMAGGFHKTGVSSYETEVIYDEDGEWKLSCRCADLAGNAAVPVDEEAFVIDQVPPRLFFDKETVEERGAYGGEICPQVRWEEENPTDAACHAVWSNLTAGGRTVACRAGRRGAEKVLTLPDPPSVREADGICVLRAEMCDLAGNCTYIRRNLSVNRFGSSFEVLSAEEDAGKTGGESPEADGAFLVAEYNVSALVRSEVTLFRNGKARILTEGEEYEVARQKNPAGMKYVYRIGAGAFSEEGRYSLLIESEDETGRINRSPGNFRQNGGGDEASFSPAWVVDRTPPTVRIAGVDTTRHRFVTDRVPLSLIPGDNLGLSSLHIRILDDQGRVLKEEKLEGEEFREILDRNRGEVPLSIEASGKWQRMEAVASDDAGNLSAGMTAAGDSGGEEPMEEYRILVSESPLVHLYRSGALPGAAFLALAGAVAVLWKGSFFSAFLR